jgi:hypothetical protein
MLRFSPSSEFGFENCLVFFHLLTPHRQTDPLQVRPEFGLGLHADHHQKNALLFFNFLHQLGTLTAPHPTMPGRRVTLIDGESVGVSIPIHSHPTCSMFRVHTGVSQDENRICSIAI